MSIKKIKKLFDKLTIKEQVVLLHDLSKNNRITNSISDFSIIHQQEYGKNITFSMSQSGPDHAPEVLVIVHTSYGDFKGTGRNKKVAKAMAIQDAIKNWD